MKIRNICKLALAAFLVLGTAGASFAQDEKVDAPKLPPKGLGPRKAAPQAAQAGPPVETVGTFGKWAVQCTEIPAQGEQPAQKSCGMVTVAANEKNPNIGIQLIINKTKQGGKSQTLMRAMVPLGVYLPTGIAMEIDGTALDGRMTFTRCMGRACEGFGEASDATLKKFLKGKAVTFYVYDRPGNGFPIKVPLTGFAEGIAALGKLAAAK